MLQVLSSVTLTSEAIQEIIDKYPYEDSVPCCQDTKTLNSVLREIKMEVSRPLRVELVICQIILLTWNKTPFLRTTEDLCLSYGFRAEDVEADETLAEFVWYMEYALMVVAAKGHMEFIINQVVAPLSERLSGRRYTAGGGTETIGTKMRYTVFELDTGLFRPTFTYQRYELIE